LFQQRHIQAGMTSNAAASRSDFKCVMTPHVDVEEPVASKETCSTGSTQEAMLAAMNSRPIKMRKSKQCFGIALALTELVAGKLEAPRCECGQSVPHVISL